MRYAQSRSVPSVNLGRVPKRYGFFLRKALILIINLENYIFYED